MAAKTINKEELGKAILNLLSYNEEIGFFDQEPREKLKVNEIEKKLSEVYQIFADSTEITLALFNLYDKKQIELGGFYIIRTSSEPVISCYIKKKSGDKPRKYS